MRRAVITGIGPVTPIGIGVPNFTGGLRRGDPGISEIEQLDTSMYDVHHAGEIKNFSLQEHCPDIKIARNRRIARCSQFALAAAALAIKDSGIVVGENVQRYDIGVRLGSGVGGLREIELQHTVLLTDKRGPEGVTPFLVPMIIPDAAASNISLRYGITGEAISVNSACASSLSAICDAYDKIKSGAYSVMITGGAEASITPLTIAAFSQAGAISKIGKSRPYDKERDGFVLGEGAGILILEDLVHARKRNAKIYGEILGYGASSDASSEVKPDPTGDGLILAINKAIDSSGVAAFDYINTHGTSTELNDAVETSVIDYMFGRFTPVSSTKSMTGHALGASGAIELIATLLAMKGGFIPPTIGYEHPDPACFLDYVPNIARMKQINRALKLSSGFGGHNVALVVGKYHGD